MKYHKKRYCYILEVDTYVLHKPQEDNNNVVTKDKRPLNVTFDVSGPEGFISLNFWQNLVNSS